MMVVLLKQGLSQFMDLIHGECYNSDKEIRTTPGETGVLVSLPTHSWKLAGCAMEEIVTQRESILNILNIE
ncbi:hypothetical protein H6P81_011224 [Aristolochia fimbriata]|uniref:Uncharacterized protein n=1 Tax=Aristolochia fimbriata TaxID=158543 RepID=A0AAV7ERL7_ARIFI|nr:hypothetical protein H6P81_011224 [Aristolochia fimbriata]